ncbi:uncharacterized protein L201_002506 [Kwoniella dendrophila CBS 6074]|uniref:Uncharacterized protein n=1 Tax=Kwoniella dendrophila CBS 6074 TaxID=1295534 RepID=A0AAX4JQD2_9TREE
MIKQIFSLLTLLVISVVAVEWHVLEFDTAANQQFIGLSGDMVVPPLPRAATYYLWPGLEDDTGVFQPVLDGRSGSWWIGTGWCCGDPSLAWGSGFGVEQGDTVHFNMVKNDTTNLWDTSLSVSSKGLYAQTSFPLADKNLNRATFAIELYDVGWDFGPLKFQNIVMTADGSNTGFCNNQPGNLYGSTNYTISATNAITGNSFVSCNIDYLTLENAQ